MNIFQQLLTSIYSPQSVSKFRFQGIGKTILYVFILMLLTTAVAGYQLASTISTTISQFQKDLSNELPDFEIKDGVLHSDVNEPIFLNQNGDLFIFDSSGTLKKLDLEKRYTNAIALLQQEAVIVSEGIAQSVQYSELGFPSMTKQNVEEITETIIELLPLIISIILFILFILLTSLKYIGIFFLTLFGLIMKKNAEIYLSYKQNWILSAYAVTLPTIFFAITNSLSIYIPFSFTLYWVVAVIMLYLIFKEIPRKIKEEQTVE